MDGIRMQMDTINMQRMVTFMHLVSKKLMAHIMGSMQMELCMLEKNFSF